MTISPETLILVGVFAHLALSISKLVFRAPKQQAQLNAIDAKVDGVVSKVQQVLPVVQTINRKSFSTPLSGFTTVEELAAALNTLSPNTLSPGASAAPSAPALSISSGGGAS